MVNPQLPKHLYRSKDNAWDLVFNTCQRTEDRKNIHGCINSTYVQNLLKNFI